MACGLAPAVATAETGTDPNSAPGSLSAITRLTGARALWQQGYTGAGIDVAVIDTGVAPVPALSDPTKVAVGPDMSFDSQDPNLRYLDGYGHGTHMAGIIAGREGPKASGATYAADTTRLYGMAPDARLVSVKVGSHDGAVDASQLIAAIDWVVQNRRSNGLNIKVLNLSFGTDSRQDWESDPLANAAEVATRAGILVVAAGGNDGALWSGLADPASDPHVMAVGAVDTRGTDSLLDDEVPSFSQHSDFALAEREPDLVAPGVAVLSPAVPGSELATRYPGALIGEDGALLRGSGTSQAAAVVSGGAALLWQRYPTLSPVQIRELMVGSAVTLGRYTPGYEGHGELSLTRALARQPASSSVAASEALRLPSTTGIGNGSLDAARGSQSVMMNGVELTGERDIFGRDWNSLSLSSKAAGYLAWTTRGAFNGTNWIGSGVITDTTSVAGRTWYGRVWAPRTWSGSSWSGSAWTPDTWSGRTWSGRTWSGDSWGDGPTSTSGTWNSRTWSSSYWR
jgi:serine protease AprX